MLTNTNTEVKCPFFIKDTSISGAVKKGVSIWLEQSTDRLKLKRNHPYWYQVQLQLGVSEFTHADFLVWTSQDMYIERIDADRLFFESQLKVADEFYISGILCRCGSEGSLLLSCGNVDCIFKKFHLKCCGLSRRPSSKKIWYCVVSRKLNKVHNASQVDRQC